MKFLKHLKANWFRYGFESLAVIVGILAALALENWNSTQQVKKEEQEILTNLYSDLKDAHQQSTSIINDELTAKDRLITALNAKSNIDPLPAYFYSDSVFSDLIWSVKMDIPVIYSYSDLKNTGETALITNEKIRQKLSNLELSMTHVRNQVDDRLRVQQLRIDELVVTRLNFVRMIKNDISEIRTDHEPTNNYPLFLEDPLARNLLAVKLTLTNDVIQYRQTLHTEILSLISLLENEIKTRYDTL